MSTQLEAYDMYLDGVKVASLKNGALNINFNNKIVRLDQVAGFIGTADAKSYGLVPKIEATTFSVDVATLWGVLLPDYVTTVTSGSQTAYYGGTNLIDMKANAKTLMFHPIRLPISNRNNDITFWQAVVNPENMQLVGNQEAFQELMLNIEVFPDETRVLEKRYFCVGDPTITDTPLKCWIQANHKANAPAFQATAYTLAADQIEQFQGFALYGDITTTATGAINDVGNITAAQTSIIFDTMAGGTFIADTYYKIENEYIYVTSVTYSGDTAGTLTAVRGVVGTTAAAHNDDTVITMVTGQSVVNHTNEGTWAASDETKAEVGDTYQGTTSGTTPTNKGYVYHVATGSSNITFTHSSVASGNLAITAS